MEGKFEGIRIILSEITPRMDARDAETYSQNKKYIFLSKHNNLRTDDGRDFRDTKYISLNAIPIFVSNISNDPCEKRMV